MNPKNRICVSQSSIRHPLTHWQMNGHLDVKICFLRSLSAAWTDLKPARSCGSERLPAVVLVGPPSTDRVWLWSDKEDRSCPVFCASSDFWTTGEIVSVCLWVFMTAAQLCLFNSSREERVNIQRSDWWLTSAQRRADLQINFQSKARKFYAWNIWIDDSRRTQEDAHLDLHNVQKGWVNLSLLGSFSLYRITRHKADCALL